MEIFSGDVMSDSFLSILGSTAIPGMQPRDAPIPIPMPMMLLTQVVTEFFGLIFSPSSDFGPSFHHQCDPSWRFDCRPFHVADRASRVSRVDMEKRETLFSCGCQSPLALVHICETRASWTMSQDPASPPDSPPTNADVRGPSLGLRAAAVPYNASVRDVA